MGIMDQIVSPGNPYTAVLPASTPTPVTQNVAVLGDRAFKEIIKVTQGHIPIGLVSL